MRSLADRAQKTEQHYNTTNCRITKHFSACHNKAIQFLSEEIIPDSATDYFGVLGKKI